MKENNEFDILIPVFNENETIVKTLKNIISVVKYNYNIFICYDYDEDPTLKIIKETERDSYALKRIDLAGSLLLELYRELWGSFKKSISLGMVLILTVFAIWSGVT